MYGEAVKNWKLNSQFQESCVLLLVTHFFVRLFFMAITCDNLASYLHILQEDPLNL